MQNALATQSMLLSEKLISFAQAARLIPPSRQGRPVSPSCIWRWHRYGVKTADGRHVRLDAAKLIHRFVTSEEAIQRFIAAQQPEPIPVNSPHDSVQAARSPARRQRESENALNRVLNRTGSGTKV